MRKILLATLVLLIVSLSNVYGWTREHVEKYALLKCVESNELVVVGRVTGKEFVTRPNIKHRFTTDITVAVDDVIKGTPNLGADRIKFMIRGGQGVSARTGKPVRFELSDQPEFKLGERVLLFLTNGESREPDDVHRPYDRYRISRAKYGKRLVVDDKVFIEYPASDDATDYTLKAVNMPIDLAIELGKAFGRNKDAAIPLENAIKNLVKSSSDYVITLNESTVDDLKSSAEAVTAPPKEDE